jgi:hypothetical protein
VTFGLWVTVVGHTFGTDTVFGYLRGGTADWLVAKEAWLGGDPYVPLDQLAEQRLGWRDVTPTEVHPRPPSALFLLGPLALIPVSQVTLALAILGAVGLSLWVVASLRWVGSPPWAEVLIVPLALSAPAVYSALWGSHIPIVAAFLAMSLLWERRPALRAGGIAFASGLKLFPFLLAFGDKRRGVRVVLLSAATFLGLTSLGLALPGVDLGAAVSALINAPGNYGASDVSLSLTSVLGWGPGAVIFPVVGVALVMVASRRLSQAGTTALSLILMVILAPYAWPEYMILWLPALLYLWRLGMVAKLGVLASLAAVALTRDGRVQLIAGIVLAIFLVRSELSSPPRDRPMVESAPRPKARAGD